MKIVNQTYRDIAPNEASIEKTPISELDQTNSLPDGSLIHVVLNNGGNKYESKKMTVEAFKQKIYDSVQNTFKTKYWDTHEKSFSAHESLEEDIAGERPKNTSFADLLNYLKRKDETRAAGGEDWPIYAPEEISKIDPDGFVDHINFDFDLIKRYMVLKDEEIEKDMGELTIRVNDLDCYFAPNMKFSTTGIVNNLETEVTSETINHNLTENDDYCQMSIESGNKISNEWTCTATGNLVIYGWLDSSACLNNKATPSAFCVIEGNIKNNWEIISVCPVAPAKTITYVGFNLMVKKGLVIRARTGFVCGVKSSQFPNQQDGYDTLSNSRANGFKCMIYQNEEAIDRRTIEEYERDIKEYKDRAEAMESGLDGVEEALHEINYGREQQGRDGSK